MIVIAARQPHKRRQIKRMISDALIFYLLKIKDFQNSRLRAIERVEDSLIATPEKHKLVDKRCSSLMHNKLVKIPFVHCSLSENSY